MQKNSNKKLIKVDFAIIDAFTNQPFSGNPAATVLVDEFPPDAWMQSLAAEINLSETSFAKPLPDQGINHFQLRWFTPTREVPLCGHATLAMAYYLYTRQAVNLDLPVIFHTLSGRLTITYQIKEQTANVQIIMDFPSVKLQDCDQKSVSILTQIFANQLTQTHTILGMADEYLLVLLPTAKDVAGFIPDFGLISQLAGFGFIITAIADVADEWDFVSRFFAPKAGINEDPVTGSAHCSLTPYWCERLGQNKLKAKQISARSGNLEVTHCDERVLLAGEAVMVIKGQTLGDISSL